MRRFVALLLFVLFLTVLFKVQADELDDITKQLNSLKSNLQVKESDQSKLIKQLEGIKSRVVVIEQDVRKKEEQVQTGEKALSHQREILNKRVFSYYKNINQAGASLIDLLIAEKLSTSLQNFFYQRSLVDEDKKTIVKIVRYVLDLEEKKKTLQSEKSRLLVIKEEVDRQAKVLGAEISSTRQAIAQLSARQQSLIASKLAALNIPRSAGTSIRGCSSDLTNGRDPGFSPRIGFFTYGAPHRNGLNQYGAKGRADAGQNAEQILQEYYPNMSLRKDYDQNAQINVEGHGAFSIEDYTKRIYEVPIDWPMETLKAQAVAARTYGLNTMQRRGSICTSEACQVFQPGEKGGRWNEAVEATRGWVLIDGGSPGFTQYASTHGGYILNLGKFDGSGGNPGGFGDLNDRAYDKASPWFYCNWGSRSEYGGTAWLKPSEVADIANVIMLARISDVDKEHLYQTDKSNPSGKETWGADRVRNELRSRGGSPIDNATDVSVSVDFGSGKVGEVNVNGVGFSGSEFKDWFNLRAPANIQIVGPLYNIERR